MSKSYRKYPIVRQEKENCHYLNRQIRRDRLAEIPNGNAYKKIKPSCNWHYYWSKEQAIQDYYAEGKIRETFPTLELWINYWKSCCLRK